MTPPRPDPRDASRARALERSAEGLRPDRETAPPARWARSSDARAALDTRGCAGADGLYRVTRPDTENERDEAGSALRRARAAGRNTLPRLEPGAIRDEAGEVSDVVVSARWRYRLKNPVRVFREAALREEGADTPGEPAPADRIPPR